VLKFQPSAYRAQISRILVRPLDFLVRRRVNPNYVTTVGVAVNLVAGLAFFLFRIQLGGALVLLGGFLDIVDGQVAVRTGQTTKFGSFYDSTTDRMAEIAWMLGLMSLYLGREPNLGEPWMAYVVAAAMAGSLMVSYTRAKAEALGIDCRVGLMQRAERIILLGGSSLFFGALGFCVPASRMSLNSSLSCLSSRWRDRLSRLRSSSVSSFCDHATSTLPTSVRITMS